MHGPHRERPAPADSGHRPWRAVRGYLVAAAVVAGAGLAGWWASSPSAAPAVATMTPVAIDRATSPAPTVPMVAATTTAAPLASLDSTPPRAAAPALDSKSSSARDVDGDLTPDLSDYANPGEHPPMAEVIQRLHAAGVGGGVGAFPPPGTKPPLVGLAVPDDYALPPGYVRHYQATDDGQRIEPILMFSPDEPPADAAGRPIASARDRVVPPELAPPGLPLRRIVVPQPAEPGSAGR
jgi:hypothetical protein